jgi:dTDP-4-dehydrorhamnose reductase
LKVLVTGANGLIGQHLVQQLLVQQYPVIATNRGACRLPFMHDPNFVYVDADLSDEMAVYDIFRTHQPAVVVHAAAMSKPDDCELNQAMCETINVKATAMIALYAEEFSQHLVYISTDFVFDGQKGYYEEDDACNPISWYGFTKVQAEGIVESSSIPWAIVRTCLVYGNVWSGTRPNIISWVKEKLEKNQSIKVVSDQWRTPTYVGDIARGISLVIQKKVSGIYHISGKELLTPYDMAVQTARFLKLDETLIEKTDASVFSQPAKRPPKTGFNITKARDQLRYEPGSFEEGLRQMYQTNALST